MLRRITIISLFFFLAEAHAQQSIIATTDTHVFFAGLPNPIKVIIEGVDSQNLIVIGENCVLTGENGNYNVKVQMGPSRICLIRAGKITSKKDTVWIKEEEFKIRPRPSPIFTVNGREGGNISDAEIQVWNFVNASFGPYFIKDGYQLSVIEYNVICQTRNGAIRAKRYSPLVDDSLKIIFSQMEGDQLIIFYDFKYTNRFNNDTLLASTNIVFRALERSIEETLNSIPDPITNKNNKEYDSAITYPDKSIYIYSGSKTRNKKDGLWTTYFKTCPSLKVAETFYHVDTIIEERQYYSTGSLLFDTKYNFIDSSAFITTYYKNGKICYSGNYKTDMSHYVSIYGYNGSSSDLFYNDTSIHSSVDLWLFNRLQIPKKPLFGEWKFYFPNGEIAAKGNFGCELYNVFEYYDFRTFNRVTREGEWNYYRPNGKLFHKVVYKKGETVKENFYDK